MHVHITKNYFVSMHAHIAKNYFVYMHVHITKNYFVCMHVHITKNYFVCMHHVQTHDPDAAEEKKVSICTPCVELLEGVQQTTL